jgi:hypothetical protein
MKLYADEFIKIIVKNFLLLFLGSIWEKLTDLFTNKKSATWGG